MESRQYEKRRHDNTALENPQITFTDQTYNIWKEMLGTEIKPKNSCQCPMGYHAK